MNKLIVCICTYDRDELLSRLLNSLRDIDARSHDLADIEILVVNNKPNPDTRRICENIAATLQMPLRYIEEHAPGLASARNRAVSEALARGAELIAFLDDDDLPEPDWLVELLAARSEDEADIVAGNHHFAGKPPWSDGLDDRRARKSADKVVGSTKIPRGARTSNVLISKKILDKMSEDELPFRRDFSGSGGEDKDFFLRAAQAGARFTFAERSIVNMHNDSLRLTARGVFDRGFKAGCSKMHVTKSHGRRGQPLALAVKSLVKLIFSLAGLPLTAASKTRRMRQVYRIGRTLGCLYFYATGRSSRYYLSK